MYSELNPISEEKTQAHTEPNRAYFSSEPASGFSWLANGLSLLLGAIIAVVGFLDPDRFVHWLATDRSPDGPGLFENLTVIILIPAILCGLYTFWRYRHRLPHPLLAYWILGWSFACLFFLGEEISWGQWYFHWSSPETFIELNRQNETNLHNMSSWFNQKPRILVEVFIALAGFLVPFWRLVTRQRKFFRRSFLREWEGWVYAPIGLLIAGFLNVITRMARDLHEPLFLNFGNGELREFLIAWFLMWYLLSYLVRLRTATEPKPFQRPSENSLQQGPGLSAEPSLTKSL